MIFIFLNFFYFKKKEHILQFCKAECIHKQIDNWHIKQCNNRLGEKNQSSSVIPSISIVEARKNCYWVVISIKSLLLENVNLIIIEQCTRKYIMSVAVVQWSILENHFICQMLRSIKTVCQVNQMKL